MADDLIQIEVAYADPQHQEVLQLRVGANKTVAEAITESGILGHFPNIDLSVNKVGIFGAVCDLKQALRAGDRIEIYRPLLIDPREARRRRVEQKGKIEKSK